MLTTRTLLLGVMCVYLSTLPYVHARSAQGIGKMERLLASYRGALEPNTPLGDLSGSLGHPVEKRQIYDTSCKGVYDRGLFSELEHVCDDCYNLYRSSYVASECRRNCYSNVVFRQCMEELLLMEEFDKYARAVQIVGKKK
uniref:Crustacean hyperglycemic hormone n=2 Tax=Cancer borealis TaxID=39395 RepID=A0A6N0DHI9_CANBE|nr:crustacean hyperglycemic hormone [Cancer borealis]QKO41651.1 crustacean hyperglycemic hormone [Cancer borealis]